MKPIKPAQVLYSLAIILVAIVVVFMIVSTAKSLQRSSTVTIFENVSLPIQGNDEIVQGSTPNIQGNTQKVQGGSYKDVVTVQSASHSLQGN